MTQPTLVFFGPDGPQFIGKNKIYLRTLIYCTAKRGIVIESLHVTVQRNESKQNFNIWVYGDNGDLKRGSGIFVPQEGITFDHHFLQPADGSNFKFKAGAYRLTVLAKLVGEETPKELMTIKLSISESQELALSSPQTAIFFDWGPDQQNYHPHIRNGMDIDSDMKKLIESFDKIKGKG
jgi:hypothetical protein